MDDTLSCHEQQRFAADSSFLIITKIQTIRLQFYSKSHWVPVNCTERYFLFVCFSECMKKRERGSLRIIEFSRKDTMGSVFDRQLFWPLSGEALVKPHTATLWALFFHATLRRRKTKPIPPWGADKEDPPQGARMISGPREHPCDQSERQASY